MQITNETTKARRREISYSHVYHIRRFSRPSDMQTSSMVLCRSRGAKLATSAAGVANIDPKWICQKCAAVAAQKGAAK